MGDGYWIKPSSIRVYSKLTGGATPSEFSEMTSSYISVSNEKIKLNTSGIVVRDVGTFTFDGNPGSVATSADLKNYVTTNTTQTISGVKTFSNSIILPPKNAIMLGTGADGKIYDNSSFYDKKLDGIVLNDMTEADTDGYYCFKKDYHSELTQYKTLTDFFGHANVLHKGGRVSNNNTKFVGFGEASGYPWFGFTKYDRDYSDGQLVESYGIMVRKGDVAGHSSAYIIDGGVSTDKETRLVTEDELAGKANVGHTHAISEISNLQSTLNGKANASHTHTISQINTLQDALDRKQNTIQNPCSFNGSNGNYVKLSRDGTSNYYVEIEHGSVTYNGSTTQYPEINVTFPHKFNVESVNDKPTVIVSFAPTSNSTGTYEALKVINVTSTGFTVITRMSASISGGYFRVNWIAIYTI